LNAQDPPDLHELPLVASPATYRARIARLRDDLERRGLAGLLIVDQASLFYLFGYDQIGYWVFQAVWLPTDSDEEVRGICRAPDRSLMERGIGIDSVQVWLDDAAESPAKTVLRWAESHRGGRIAVELNTHALRADYAMQLFRYADSFGLELLEGDDIVMSLRQVKDADELMFMRQAGAALDSAFAAVRGRVEAGVLETQLSSAALQALLAEGCDPAAVSPCISAGRRTMFQTHLSAKPLPLEEGEFVTVELGAAINRYHSVGYHTYFTETAKQEYWDQYQALQDAMHLGLAELAPGRDASEVAAIVHRHLESTGNGRSGRHVGYGTGIGFPPTWLEDLRIKNSQSYALQPGMTFFLFAGAPTRDGTRHMGYGIPVVITDDGAEPLSATL